MIEYGVGWARSAQDDAPCSPSDDGTFPEARVARWLGIIYSSGLSIKERVKERARLSLIIVVKGVVIRESWKKKSRRNRDVM
jgi:hypothetical protein